MRNSSPFRPFFELNFGGARISLSCNNNTACSGTSFSKSAFAMTVGGGFDMKLSKKFSLALLFWDPFGGGTNTLETWTRVHH